MRYYLVATDRYAASSRSKHVRPWAVVAAFAYLEQAQEWAEVERERDRDSYRPGQRASWVVRIADSDGWIGRAVDATTLCNDTRAI